VSHLATFMDILASVLSLRGVQLATKSSMFLLTSCSDTEKLRLPVVWKLSSRTVRLDADEDDAVRSNSPLPVSDNIRNSSGSLMPLIPLPILLLDCVNSDLHAKRERIVLLSRSIEFSTRLFVFGVSDDWHVLTRGTLYWPGLPVQKKKETRNTIIIITANIM